MQGESDARFSRRIAKRYEANLALLMGRFRSVLGDPDLPIAIGRISDSGKGPNGRRWAFSDIVRQTQAEFADTDPNTVLVTSTDGYGYVDSSHYDAAANLDLGRRFAEAIIELQAGNARSETRSLFRMSPVSNVLLFVSTVAALAL